MQAVNNVGVMEAIDASLAEVVRQLSGAAAPPSPAMTPLEFLNQRIAEEEAAEAHRVAMAKKCTHFRSRLEVAQENAAAAELALRNAAAVLSEASVARGVAGAAYAAANSPPDKTIAPEAATSGPEASPTQPALLLPATTLAELSRLVQDPGMALGLQEWIQFQKLARTAASRPAVDPTQASTPAQQPAAAGGDGSRLEARLDIKAAIITATNTNAIAAAQKQVEQQRKEHRDARLAAGGRDEETA